MWDPDVYLAFADDRARPFYDLLSRVGAQQPRRVVDLGCGPGNLTLQLARRWPALLADAYPPRHDGTTFFPFRRVFVVAQVGG